MNDFKTYGLPRKLEITPLHAAMLCLVFLAFGVLFGAQGAKWEAQRNDEARQERKAAADLGGYVIENDVDAAGHADRARGRVVRKWMGR